MMQWDRLTLGRMANEMGFQRDTLEATGTVFLGSLSVPDGSALDEIFGFAVYGKDILTQKCYDEAITGRES